MNGLVTMVGPELEQSPVTGCLAQPSLVELLKFQLPQEGMAPPHSGVSGVNPAMQV